MRLRLLLVLCLVPALILVSGAAGSSKGSKYKVRLVFAAASCNGCDLISLTKSIVVRRLDDDQASCRPFVDGNDACKWTARAGTKVVIVSEADPAFTEHHFGGDCSGDKCVLVMDSNKSYFISWSIS